MSLIGRVDIGVKHTANNIFDRKNLHLYTPFKNKETTGRDAPQQHSVPRGNFFDQFPRCSHF
jgi:hypothetical protein